MITPYPKKAGANTLEELEDTFYGHCRYGAEDPVRASMVFLPRNQSAETQQTSLTPRCGKVAV